MFWSWIFLCKLWEFQVQLKRLVVFRGENFISFCNRSFYANQIFYRSYVNRQHFRLRSFASSCKTVQFKTCIWVAKAPVCSGGISVIFILYISLKSQNITENDSWIELSLLQHQYLQETNSVGWWLIT